MTSLADFELVRDNLRTGRKKNITALHKFIFQNEGDRTNRKCLRQFTGFEYTIEDDEYNTMSAYVDQELSDADLTTICVVLGLNYDVENKKLHIFNNLIKGQLLRYGEQQEEDDEDNDEDDDEDDDDQDDDHQEDCYQADVRQYKDNHNVEQHKMTAHSDSSRRSVNKRPQQSRFTMNFRDIEDSIKSFDGNSGSSVVEWVQEFEEMATVMDWDQLQMLVFAKKSLTGLAKRFVQGERYLTSWPKLKGALLSEFKCRMLSRQLHQKLRETTMTRGESAMEYLYNMKYIAANGNIDEKELIMYIIEGIRDVNTNKQMLYGAQNMREFMGKIRDYEDFVSQTYRRNADKKPVMYQDQMTSERKTGAIKKKVDSVMRCYKCGHKSNVCTNKAKGTKSFNCGNFGHLA